MKPVSETLRGPVWWTLGWLAVTVAGIAYRPLLPVDETRYLSVAWEMWTSGDWLVPHLNGQTYSHKPPLLFWAINAGWAVFGVSEWWGRMVAPLFALGGLFLARRLALALWPGARGVADTVPVLLLGTVVWIGFATLTYFDMLVGFFALLGLLGVVDAAKRAGVRGWALLGLAIGLGVLSKGPVILVHVLPPVLFAPLWAGRLNWVKWYLGALGAVGLGAAIALAWALPAAKAGGPVYENAILWGQTAGRVSNSFAHGRPWWFYAAVIAPMLLPWIAWPRTWKATKGFRNEVKDSGVRFCLVWFVGATLVLSMVSGKQVHYLLPSLPAAILVLARILAPIRERLTPVAMMVLALGVIGHAGASPWLARGYDLAPLAQEIRALQDAGVPIGHASKYHGQYHFLGRLNHPLTQFWEHQVQDWALDHPEGVFVAHHNQPPGPLAPKYWGAFRSKAVAIWPASAVWDDPRVSDRDYGAATLP